VNKDAHYIFESYSGKITEAADVAAIKKRYDDGITGINNSGLKPEEIASLKKNLAQEWQAEKETLGADAGNENLKEIDAMFGTGTTQPVSPAQPTAQPTSPIAPATQTPIPTVRVGRPGDVTPRPPSTPAPASTVPPAPPTIATPGAPIPSYDPNIKLRTGTYSDVPVPTTQTPVPGVNVPKPGTVQTPAPAAAATSSTTIAPAAAATAPEQVRKATAVSTTPYIDTTKGRRLTTRR